MQISNLALIKLMKVLKNNLAKNYIFVNSFLYARQNTGLIWQTAGRPSVHASYGNISHLFPLLLIVIDHVVTYIVLIKGHIMAQLFILSYFDAVSFRDIWGHLGTIHSIVTLYICACRRRRL